MPNITKISDRQKALQGDKRFIKNTPDSAPIEKLWRTPQGLSDASKAFHKDVGSLLVRSRVLTELDRYGWFQLCGLYGYLVELTEIIEKEGFTVGKPETARRHPATTIYREYYSMFQKSLEKYGLTPADRHRIDLAIDANPKTDQDGEFFFGKPSKK